MKRVKVGDRTYTVKELAAKLGVTPLTVYKWKNGVGKFLELPSHAAGDNGKTFVFKHREVTAWIQENRPELLWKWNGQIATIAVANSWTRRRLREQLAELERAA